MKTGAAKASSFILMMQLVSTDGLLEGWVVVWFSMDVGDGVCMFCYKVCTTVVLKCLFFLLMFHVLRRASKIPLEDING